MTNGSPVYITANNGSPVYITGAGAGSIPASAISIAATPGFVGADQPLTTTAGGAIVPGSGFYESVLFKTALPFVMAGSGSMGNNGALTLTTALGFTYAAAYTYLPLGAISAGSTAGWYYTVFSSATVGTVYNNVYTGSSAPPTIPATLTPFLTTGPGAYTGASSAIGAQSYAMPGGTMGGIRDSVRITQQYSFTSSSAIKGTSMSVGGSNIWSYNDATSGNQSLSTQCLVSNRESLSSQIGFTSGVVGIGAVANAIWLLVAANMANQQNITAAMTNSTPATNNIVSEVLVIELLKGS